MAFGIDLSGRVADNLQPWLTIIGITLVISGVCVACWGFYAVLAKDSCTLILQSNGISYETQESSCFISWQDITVISCENNFITIQQTNGQSLEISEIFLGITTQQLVEKLKATQRDSLLGVIRS